MWTSNRRHVYRVCGIRLHPNGGFSNVLMQNQRHENRKTSGWSKSTCSVQGRYRHTEQALFDQPDVFRFSCRWFCINTFENPPFGCNLMPQTR